MKILCLTNATELGELFFSAERPERTSIMFLAPMTKIIKKNKKKKIDFENPHGLEFFFNRPVVRRVVNSEKCWQKNRFARWK